MSSGTAIGLRSPTTALPCPRTVPPGVKLTPNAPGICCSRSRSVSWSISSRIAVTSSGATVVRSEASFSARMLCARPPSTVRSVSTSSSVISTTR